MEILFVVDSIKDLDRKISLITDTFGVNIKFFVSAKHVKDLAKNKYIVGKIASIYSSSVNVAIDQYLKSNVYTPKPTILYVSSAELTTRVIEGFRENLKLAPHTIYLKKTCTWWDRFKLWFYKKVINTIFGMKDEFASVKLQYFSAEVMSELAETNFRNHIFSLENSLTIEVSEEEAKSHYYGFKFNKRLLYNPIAFCLILICYVVLERFLVLPFWVYLLLVALILAIALNTIVMMVKNRFDIRFKK